MKVITWNMQGAADLGDYGAKWRLVQSMFTKKNVDMVFLQECGNPPESSVSYHEIGLISLRFWFVGRKKLVNMMHYAWDVAGHRVNQAIVSQANIDPSEVLALTYPANGPSHRPAIGIKKNGNGFYCVHAISPGGADVRKLVAAIEGHALNGKYIFGDFNRQPETVENRMGNNFNVYDTNLHTYSARNANPTKTYDYGINNIPATWAEVGTVMNIIQSDHYPVIYEL